MKCATVTILGRPSVGKSTLVNTICEGKVSIIADIPQTTRHAIRGIYTDQRGQLILTDTPGYHLGTRRLNEKLQTTALAQIKESDLLLYITDAIREVGEEEEAIAEIVHTSGLPAVIAVNKIDIARPEQITEMTAFLTQQVPHSKIIPISALDDEGVDELLIELFALAPEGELLYPANAYTDQPLEFRIAEIIREKAINIVTEEIPHAIFVEVADLEYYEAEKSVWVRAFINVEKESQKGIVVGKGGTGIRSIRRAAFKDIARLFPDLQLHVDLRVKVAPRWRTNEYMLNQILS